MEGDRQRCLAAGMDDYIAKPIIAAELYATLEQPRAATPGSSPPSGDAFDPEPALARCEGDRELFAGLIAIFLADYPGYLDRLREAAAANDAEAMYRAAHTLKGPLGTLGLDDAMNLVAELEQIAERGDLAVAVVTIELLTRRLERTAPQLAVWTAAPPENEAAVP
jgi:HPt (histidine-containing phosphotransfer) domain-containing protein